MDELDIDVLLEKALENNGQVPELPTAPAEEEAPEPEKKEESRDRRSSRKRSHERDDDHDRSSRRHRHSRSRSPHRSSRRRSPHRSRRPGDAQREREREKERERRRREEDRKRQREDEARLTPSEREAIEIERDQRTVFACNLPLKADEDDIAEWFSKVGKVRDIRLITDRNSRKSKGFGYIEFYDRATVPAALTLSGTHMMGHTVQVQVTQAEKNRQAAARAAPTAVSYGPTRLYVGGLHSHITEEDLHDIFKPFGDIENIVLHKDVEGKSKGFGFVQFRRPDEAKKAMDKTNGIEVAGKAMRVGLVNEKASTGSADSQSMFGDLDDDEDRGVSMNTSARLMLMEKLQRPGAPIVQPDQVKKPAAPAPPPPQAAPVKVQPSPCVKLTNMFDPEEETEAGWPEEIKNDTKEECNKFGSVVHIYVEQNSKGNVFLKFGSIPGAQNAINALNGRWFASRMITAEFVPEKQYYSKFPEARNR